MCWWYVLPMTCKVMGGAHQEGYPVKIIALISSVHCDCWVGLFEKQVRASFIDDMQNYKHDGHHSMQSIRKTAEEDYQSRLQFLPADGLSYWWEVKSARDIQNWCIVGCYQRCKFLWCVVSVCVCHACLVNLWHVLTTNRISGRLLSGCACVTLTCLCTTYWFQCDVIYLV